MFVENPQGSSDCSFDLPAVVEPALFRVTVESSMRCAADSASVAIAFGQRGKKTAVQRSQLPASRLEVVRDRYAKRGFSAEVVELLLGAVRDNTHSAYDSGWKIWSDWCLGRSNDPLCNAVPVVASFLAEQSKSKAYSTVNIYRSTLSSVLERIDGLPIGQHPEIVLLIKGIFNRRPPLAKFNSTWDVDVVLSYLRNQENASLPLKDLAAKLATLLALATLFRSSDLAAISSKSIKFLANRVSFSLTCPRKAQKSGALQSFTLERLSDESLDPVAGLKCYISRTESFRKNSNNDLLFISSVGQHNPVKSQTISNWIKKVLKDAGIDVEIFSSHSTRGAAASKAVAVGASLDSVLSAGHWASSSTFKQFYHREKDPGPSVAASVLIPGNDWYPFIWFKFVNISPVGSFSVSLVF